MCMHCSCCDWECDKKCKRDSECGCFLLFNDENRVTVFDEGNIKFKKHKEYSDINHDLQRFEYDDIYSVYVHIAKGLMDKKNLSDKEIIALTNDYKKLSATHSELTSEEIDSLPDMPEIWEDMQLDLMELLYEHKLLLYPDNINIGQIDTVLEYYITYTDETVLENIRIASDGEGVYYVFLNDEEYYFKIVFDVFVCGEESGGIMISHETPLNSAKLFEASIPITSVDSKIPVVALQ